MIHAYDELYIDEAMKNLGEAFDYAVNGCGLKLDQFVDMFITEGIANQFGTGSPKYVAGLSGMELVLEVTSRAGLDVKSKDTFVEYDCSPEYWCGWILAYYQWYTRRSFKEIKGCISMENILNMYPTLHEASMDKFVDNLESIIESQKMPTKLQTFRKYAGYSQATLASKSGVSLRMIQQYEQRAKDINKASVTNLVSLALVLGCRVEELLEKTTINPIEN